MVMVGTTVSKVPNTITLKLVLEDRAFTKVDEFEKEFAKELVKSGRPHNNQPRAEFIGSGVSILG